MVSDCSWYQGTIYAEKKNRKKLKDGEDVEEAAKVLDQIETIKKHRHFGQPYVSIGVLCIHIRHSTSAMIVGVLGIRYLHDHFDDKWSLSLHTYRMEDW